MSRSVDDVSEADWSAFQRDIGDRLIDVAPPLQACLADPTSSACADALASLSNPFAIEDNPGAFHTTGWLRAFDSRAPLGPWPQNQPRMWRPPSASAPSTACESWLRAPGTTISDVRATPRP